MPNGLFFRPSVVKEDHPLLSAVASWPGRGVTQLEFEARGLTLHKAWQSRMIQFCGQECSNLLNRYWDEIASETMQCLGRSSIETRVFVIEPKYRSDFLDELFAARDFAEPASPAPLIQCLFDYDKRILRDYEFAQTESGFFGKVRTAESERFGIDATGWSGKKRDVIPFVERFCSAVGFERRRNRWRKKTDQGLVFEVGVDLGGKPYCLTVPLTFRIYHSDDTKLVFDIRGDAIFQHLIPGSFLYRHGQAASEWVLGIKAYVDLFDVIANSFGQPAGRTDPKT